MTRALIAFARFWYDFIVGDDPLLALTVVAGLAGTYLVARAGIAAWWLLPALVLAVLLVSVTIATRSARRSSR